MPKRLTYEELMDDAVTRRILKMYPEKGEYILRRNEIKRGLSESTGKRMNDMTLQRRLDRLCEEGVLRKVDGNGNPIEGGNRAPETYYELVDVHAKVTIKSADMERLRGESPDRLVPGILTTIYGFDESDFEEAEDDKRAFLEVLEKMDSLAIDLLMLKVKTLQRMLEKVSSALDDKGFDPITDWAIKCYVWMNALAPFSGSEVRKPEEFLFTIMMVAAQEYALDETIDEDERARIAESVGKATVLAAWVHVELGDLIKAIGEKSLRGTVVVHVTPTLGDPVASYDRLEDMFRRYLRSRGEVETKDESFLFEWLRDLIPDVDDDRRPGGQPFRATLRRHVRMAPDRLKERLDKRASGSLRQFIMRALDTRLLDPPKMPTIEDIKEYWERKEFQT